MVNDLLRYSRFDRRDAAPRKLVAHVAEEILVSTECAAEVTSLIQVSRFPAPRPRDRPGQQSTRNQVNRYRTRTTPPDGLTGSWGLMASISPWRVCVASTGGL